MVISLLACALACRPKSPPTAPASFNAARFAHDPNIPTECKVYALAMKRCMESPGFPPELREPERTAVEQMMEGSTLPPATDADPPDPAARMEAYRAIAQNCRDSMNTMQDSGKVTCPGVF